MFLFSQAQILGRVHPTIAQAYFRPGSFTGNLCDYEQVFLLKRLTNILHVNFSKPDSFQYGNYVVKILIPLNESNGYLCILDMKLYQVQIC